MTDVIIRKETPGDYKTIQIINNLSLSLIQEGNLIENLRKKAEFVPELSLVAIYKNIL